MALNAEMSRPEAVRLLTLSPNRKESICNTISGNYIDLFEIGSKKSRSECH